MKAVDWILELPGRTCFVEVKDLDAPKTREHDDRNRFLHDFLSNRLTGDLVSKFRDSFLYEWACNRVEKPISFYVIVAAAELDDAQLQTRTEDLKRRLPVGQPVNWARSIVEDCLVFNIAKWNTTFPEYRLNRVQS